MKKFNFAKLMHKFAAVLSCAFLVTPAVQCECTTTKSAAMQDVKKEKLIVDCAFSVGHDCACAMWLRKYNLRYQSSPLDWMYDYSLNTVAHLFETGFKDFFKQVKVDKNRTFNNHVYVYDTKNHIESRHHYDKDAPFKKEKVRVDKIMAGRAKKVMEIMKKSNSIALISHREEPYRDFIKFIERMGKVYPDKKIYLINVRHGKSHNISSKVVYKKDNLEVIDYTFFNKDNSLPWYGNPKGWKEVMESLKLREKHDIPKSLSFHD